MEIVEFQANVPENLEVIHWNSGNYEFDLQEGVMAVIGMGTLYKDDLVQDCSKSIANALELLQSCTTPSINAT